MNEPELPQDPPGWAERDREFALARSLRNEKGRAAYGEMSHEVMPPPFTDRLYGITSVNPLLRGIADGDEASIEVAIAWLEADPFALWTGYLKQKIMCRLCGASLSDSQKSRLRHVLLRITTRGPRMEFRDACRLAPHVDDPEFRNRLRNLATRPEAHISYAAGRMLAACETKGKRNGTG
jgi:hypothetical protein